MKIIKPPSFRHPPGCQLTAFGTNHKSIHGRFVKMNKVTVYTTTRCPYCMMLKKFLKEQDIPFTEVNLDKNPSMIAKLVNTTGQLGVPQTEVNGRWIIGYDPARILEALK
jgi:glutaredoxin